MKSLRDEGVSYKPERFDASVIESDIGKKKLGIHLLKAFLFDGLVRGVDSSGDVYIHKTSAILIERFLSGLAIHLD